MTNFQPKYIFFNNQESERGKCIEFGWGGGLSYWGIVIGSPSIEVQQDGVTKRSKSYKEFRRSIKPGVYIFEGG